MNLENITIVNFKNLVECQLDFSPNINCFIGNNGMGKTNVLDAIYYLSFVKSCSNVSDQLVLNHAADYMMLRGRYRRCGEPVPAYFLFCLQQKIVMFANKFCSHCKHRHLL